MICKDSKNLLHYKLLTRKYFIRLLECEGIDVALQRSHT